MERGTSAVESAALQQSVQRIHRTAHFNSSGRKAANYHMMSTEVSSLAFSAAANQTVEVIYEHFGCTSRPESSGAAPPTPSSHCEGADKGHIFLNLSSFDHMKWKDIGPLDDITLLR